MKDPQQDRIAAAFDRELARSPVPPELRAQAVRYAMQWRHSPERRRQPLMLALVAALLAFAIVATLVFAAQALHKPHATPANPPQSVALAPGTYFLANPYLGQNPPPLDCSHGCVPGQYPPGLNCNRGCASYRQIDFTLPAGWSMSDGLVYKHLNQPGEVAFSAWTVDQIYDNPCHWQRSTLSALDLPTPTPREGGLAHQSLRGPLPRPLIPATFAYLDASGASWPTDAWRIDLSVPANLDISTCDKGQFRSWTVWEVADGADSHYAPGQLDSVYIIDVDRRALVIDASHMPGTSAADLAELNAIIASMNIDRG